jgi:hypothetical protein
MGNTQEGIKAFQDAQVLAPYLPMLRSLREEFPALGAVPLPQEPEVAQPGAPPEAPVPPPPGSPQGAPPKG